MIIALEMIVKDIRKYACHLFYNIILFKNIENMQK